MFFVKERSNGRKHRDGKKCSSRERIRLVRLDTTAQCPGFAIRVICALQRRRVKRFETYLDICSVINDVHGLKKRHFHDAGLLEHELDAGPEGGEELLLHAKARLAW